MGLSCDLSEVSSVMTDPLSMKVFMLFSNMFRNCRDRMFGQSYFATDVLGLCSDYDYNGIVVVYVKDVGYKSPRNFQISFWVQKSILGVHTDGFISADLMQHRLDEARFLLYTVIIDFPSARDSIGCITLDTVNSVKEIVTSIGLKVRWFNFFAKVGVVNNCWLPTPQFITGYNTVTKVYSLPVGKNIFFDDNTRILMFEMCMFTLSRVKSTWDNDSLQDMMFETSLEATVQPFDTVVGEGSEYAEAFTSFASVPTDYSYSTMFHVPTLFLPNISLDVGISGAGSMTSSFFNLDDNIGDRYFWGTEPLSNDSLRYRSNTPIVRVHIKCEDLRMGKYTDLYSVSGDFCFMYFPSTLFSDLKNFTSHLVRIIEQIQPTCYHHWVDYKVMEHFNNGKSAYDLEDLVKFAATRSKRIWRADPKDVAKLHDAFTLVKNKTRRFIIGDLTEAETFQGSDLGSESGGSDVVSESDFEG